MPSKYTFPDEPLIDFNYHQQFHQPIPEKKSNMIEITIDSLGGSQRYLSEVEARVCNSALKQSLSSINKQIKEPEKKFFIETHRFGDMSWWVIYNIQPDGSHLYNETLSRHVLNNGHNLWLIHTIMKQAIFA